MTGVISPVIFDLFQEYSIPFKRHGEHHHVSHDWIGIDCPYCSPDSSRFRLGYNLKYGFATCWQCGYKNIVKVLCEITGESWLAIRTKLGATEQDRAAYGRETTCKKAGKIKFPNGIGPLLPAHRRYLKQRGFDPDKLMSLWNLMGIGIAAELSWRIVIPIRYRSEPVSWTARSISDAGLRYINAKASEEKLSAKFLLYGEDYVRHSIIVVEGPADVWKIGPGAVATLGVSWTQAQLLKIAKYPRRTIIFDADAQKQARRLCESLSIFPGKTIRIEIDAKDPGSASERELVRIRRQLR